MVTNDRHEKELGNFLCICNVACDQPSAVLLKRGIVYLIYVYGSPLTAEDPNYYC